MNDAHSYVVIPHIRVDHANALQTWWVMGPPSPMTVCGFVRALGMKLGVAFDAYAIVHHNVRWLAAELSGMEYAKRASGGREDKNWDVMFWNHRVIPQQVQGATYINKQDHIAGGFSKGLQPTARCHVEMSLVLRTPMSSLIDPQDISRALWSGFFGGGSIVEHGPPVLKSTQEDVKGLLTSGFFVVDRADLTLERMQAANAGADALEVILDTLIARPRAKHGGAAKNDSEAADVEREGEYMLDPLPEPKVWLSANVVGYLALETPQERAGVRGEFPHAYAETLVGLIEYRSVRKSPSIPFWSYVAQPERRAYFVRGQAPAPAASRLPSAANPYSI
ncbi:MAG: hypothetical protein HIU89_08235 [Proteobacteria bacterium]|nr:hypothetical protein [Pseudomonadota bacterium]